MFLVYGTYSHAPGEVTLTIQKQAIKSPIGRTIGLLERWTISGILHAETVLDLTAALLSLELAYSRDGLDAGLFTDAGVATAHQMVSRQAQGGVKVVARNFNKGDHAEYVTFRSYEIVLEARFISAGFHELISWTETLAFTGTGGPRFILQQPFGGTPQKWQVATNTPCHCTQQGTAIYFFRYAEPPAPLFPDHEHLDRRKVERKHPEIINGVFQNFAVTWNFEFESIEPFFGVPNAAPLQT